MKSGLRRIFSGILVIALAITLSVPAFATELKSFSDVSETHWAYSAIMRSVELGLIYGTKDPDENGVGEFAPNGTMTRAQFITVVMRAVAKDELNEYQGSGKYWYSNAAELAVDLGILERMDFDGISNAENMNKAITREEMAHILAKATNYLGLEAVNKVSTNSITDWSKVSPNYQQDVLTTYRMGMITGYGYPGNFGAKDTMTRAQACIVLNRLLDTGNRTKLPSTTTNPQTPSGTKDFDKNDYSTYRGYTIPGQTATAQTWKEGEKHSVPKVGDTIIAKDGTKYTIQATYTQNRCVLGFGIPCDIWTGTVAPDGTVTTVANGTGWWGDDFSSMKRNTATGEVHTSLEWDSLINAGLIKRPTTKGTYDGQVSGYYIWRVIDGAYGTDADWSFENRTK